MVWLVCILLAGASALRADTTVEWKGGEGDWDDEAKWGGTLPWRTAEARINGTRAQPSNVMVSRSDVLVSHLGVGDGGNSRASLVLDGRTLAVTAGIDVGKYDGSEGKLLVKSGELFANTIFVSGGGGPGMKGRGTVEIEDGSMVTKLIELGLSSGSDCTLRMVGSKAAGVMVEDGLQIGVYNYLSLESNPPPSTTELISSWMPRASRRSPPGVKLKVAFIFPFPMAKAMAGGHADCESACWPRRRRATFFWWVRPTHAAAGSPDWRKARRCGAEFAGKIYEWTLTYRGGLNKCDILLTEARIADAAGKMIPYVTGKPAKVFRFDPVIAQSSYQDFYRQWDAQTPPAWQRHFSLSRSRWLRVFYERGTRG